MNNVTSKFWADVVSHFEQETKVLGEIPLLKRHKEREVRNLEYIHVSMAYFEDRKGIAVTATTSASEFKGRVSLKLSWINKTFSPIRKVDCEKYPSEQYKNQELFSVGLRGPIF